MFAGSPEAWAAHAVEGSIGCRDRLICSEGRARASLWGLIIGWTHLPYEIKYAFCRLIVWVSTLKTEYLCSRLFLYCMRVCGLIFLVLPSSFGTVYKVYFFSYSDTWMTDDPMGDTSHPAQLEPHPHLPLHLPPSCVLKSPTLFTSLPFRHKSLARS